VFYVSYPKFHRIWTANYFLFIWKIFFFLEKKIIKFKNDNLIINDSKNIFKKDKGSGQSILTIK